MDENRPHNGECFVYVQPKFLQSVLACHRKHMGPRYVEVIIFLKGGIMTNSNNIYIENIACNIYIEKAV